MGQDVPMGKSHLRRLMRTYSVAEYDPQAYAVQQKAYRVLNDVSRLLKLVRGAECACTILQQAAANNKDISEDELQRALCSRRCKVRPCEPLSEAEVPVALLLLMSRTAGSVCLRRTRGARLRFHVYKGASLESAKLSLQQCVKSLEGKYRQCCKTTKRAFIDTIPASQAQTDSFGSSDSEPESCACNGDDASLRKRPRRS